MAVPFRRTGKTRKRTRRTHFKLEVKGLVACPHCGEMIQPHKVCPHCGYYDGKQVNNFKKEEVKPATAPKAKKATKASKKTEATETTETK